MRRVSATEIEGSKLLGTFCYNPQKVFPVYFVLRVTKTPSRSGYWKKQRPMTGPEAQWTPDQGKYKLYTEYGRELSGDDVGYWFSFDDLQEGETVEVRMGVSFVSTENARANLDAEQRGRSFDALRDEARATWNADLGRIRVEGGTDAQRTVFYTALYHTMIAPVTFCDVDGSYRGADGEVHPDPGYTTYSVFSLWDTYRAKMPLLTLVEPERMADIVNTMLAIADEQGRLPVWHLWGNETDCMVGNPGVVVVADAIVKNIPGVDRERAFEAIRRTAMNEGRGNGLRMKYGYIPCDLFNEAVAYDLEYALADGAAALAARALGKKTEEEYLASRSRSYRHLFRPLDGLHARPRLARRLAHPLQPLRLVAPRRRLLRGQRLAVYVARAARR